MRRLPRPRDVGRATALYGVAGAPLAHSASPAMHNAAFAALGIDAVYVPLDDGRLPTSSSTWPTRSACRARASPLRSRRRGLRAVTERRRRSRGASARSTRCAGDGDGWEGRNFDVAGFLAPLERRRWRLAGTRVRRARRRRRRARGGAGRCVERARTWTVAARRARAAPRRSPREFGARAVRVAADAGLGPAGQRDAGRHVAATSTRRRSTPTLVRWPARLRPDLQPAETTLLAMGARARAPRPSAGSRCSSARPARSSSGGPAAGAAPTSCERRRDAVLCASTEARMKQTTFEEFVELAQRGTFVPVCREIMADLLTPVSAFLKIAEHSDYAFLLESVEGGEQVGRYSFLGKDPFLILRGRDGETIDRAGRRARRSATEPFVDVLRELMAEFQSPFVPGLPRFTGGAVGLPRLRRGRVVRAGRAPRRSRRPIATRPGSWCSTRCWRSITSSIASWRSPTRGCARARTCAALYDFACAKIEFLERELERNLSQPTRRPARRLTVVANQTREQFEAAVRPIQEDIAAGEIYQAVLSQRFEATTRRRRSTSIARCATSTRRPTCSSSAWARDAIVGASPEMLVRVEGRHVETHPIAGTRRRGGDARRGSARWPRSCRRNEKERAEHVMLVDLGRNDIGPRRGSRQRARAAVHGARALLARHAPRVARRGPARRGPRSARRAGRHASRPAR